MLPSGRRRHRRHVTGRGARGTAEERGRRAPTRRIGLSVLPERSGGMLIGQAAGHGQVADLTWSGPDGASPAEGAAEG
jgi:hypothetical protein